MKPRIYLDNSATTRVDPKVLDTMIPFFRDVFGNASSIHTFGQDARAAVEDSRRAIADLLGADTREIVFTSGGTESDNAAIRGVYRSGGHIITTRIEHPAILATCKALQSEGAEVTYVPVDSSGRVDPVEIAASITDRTLLISVMHANNETGVIQPIEEILALARARGIAVHTDAVQSVGKIPVDVRRLGVDLLSMSGHKIHGPKGIGVLYVRKGTKLTPFMTGGSHERKRRAGTENVPAVVGLGAAARLALTRLPEMAARVAGLRDHLERQDSGEDRRCANQRDGAGSATQHHQPFIRGIGRRVNGDRHGPRGSCDQYRIGLCIRISGAFARPDRHGIAAGGRAGVAPVQSWLWQHAKRSRVGLGILTWARTGFGVSRDACTPREVRLDSMLPQTPLPLRSSMSETSTAS